ncbi:MAG: molecular chaperone [Hyphomonadaceae bacterium]
MRWAAFLIGALAFFVLQCSARAAPQVEVAPVVVELPAGKAIASIRIRNVTDAPVAFEARVYAWSQDDAGRDVLRESGDLAVWPPAFVAPSGGAQIVRVAAQTASAPAVERAYRVVFSQQPLGVEAAEGLRLRLQLSLPVFVAPAHAMDRAPEMFMVEGAPRRLRVTNPGNRRITLDIAENPSLPRYLLAGSTVEGEAAAPPRSARFAAAGGDMRPLAWPGDGRAR